ncbi:MAG: protease pro-enzyme activation domain-containing protein [Bryobacteraceae bacterium]
MQDSVVLEGHVNPLARVEFDLGPVEPALPMRSLVLMLKPSADRQAELDRLLTGQQDPHSPLFHHWLEPEEFAARFAFSAGDIAKIRNWLERQGFSIDYVPRSRNWVTFSGTATQVERAFHTSIHRYAAGPETHFANTGNPSVPSDLAPLTLGILGLDDFAPKPLAKPRSLGVSADYTTNGAHYLYPGDFATIYDLLPLYQQGDNGAGQKIGIVGRCQISTSDIATFRGVAGLPSSPIGNYLQTVLPTGAVNPGPTGAFGPGDCGEAYLDTEWAGAVAPDATVVYVYATNVLLAVQWIIDNRLTPVMSMSFGACEAQATPNGIVASSYLAISQQANAEGITWMVPTGDSGPADCDLSFASPAATMGDSVNVYASLPGATAVGGTQFNEGANSAAYWNSTDGTGGTSARQYVPEAGWNESDSTGLAASGGGLSQLFPQPSWQTGSGVPSQNFRAVPDISLSAAFHDGYITYYGGEYYVNEGTSAGAPAFAGTLAVLNQYWTAKGLTAFGQGNINPNLYRMAQSAPSAFHDIVSGNNIVPCLTGTPECTTGSFGYSAGVGYDLVTGLGSVDANSLVELWNANLVNSTITVSAEPATFAVGASTELTVTVKAAASSATPTGTVTFGVGSSAVGSARLSGSSGTATASLSLSSAQLASAAGAYTLTTSYSGDANFNGSSATVVLTTTLVNSTTTISANPAVFAVGSSAVLTATVSGAGGSGTPTGAVTFNLGSLSLGSGALSGSNGTATASLSVSSTQLGSTAGAYNITATYGGDATFNGSSASVSVTTIVPTLVPAIGSVENAASYASGTVSPGEIVTLFGSDLGPSQLTMLTLTSAGLVSTQLAGTVVSFSDIAAPLLYTSAGQVAAIVPYEVTGATANVTVAYQRQTSAPFPVTVASSVPAIFTANASGTGQAVALNQDYTVNSPSNPAVSGQVVILYASGEGQTTPGGVDGQPAIAPYPSPLLAVSVTIGNVPAEVKYAGGAPGLVAGVMQVNVVVPLFLSPTTVSSAQEMPVILTVGNAASPSGVTLAVSGATALAPSGR